MIFSCILRHFGHSSRRHLILFKICFSKQLPCLGLACRFWSTFVGFTSSDSLVSRALPMLIWSASFFWCFWAPHLAPSGPIYSSRRFFPGCQPLLSNLLGKQKPHTWVSLVKIKGKEQRDTVFHCCPHCRLIRPSPSLDCGSKAGMAGLHQDSGCEARTGAFLWVCAGSPLS